MIAAVLTLATTGTLGTITALAWTRWGARADAKADSLAAAHVRKVTGLYVRDEVSA